MRNIIKHTIAIALIYLVLDLILDLPWFTIYLIPLAYGLAVMKDQKFALLPGFLALFLVWTSQALFIDLSNDSLLSQKVGDLFTGLGSTGILLVTGIFGGLVAGLGSLTGTIISKIIR